MRPDRAGLPGVILAGGKASPAFTQRTGLTSRALLDVGGKTMLERIAEALAMSPSVTSVTIVGNVPHQPGTISLPDQGDFVANVLAGLSTCAGQPHALIATSDMPFVDAAMVDAFVEQALAVRADLVYPIVPMEVCLAAYPALRRTSLTLREGRFTGGNMLLVRPDVLLAQRDRIRDAHTARKSPLRLASMLGIGVTLAVACSLLTGRGVVRLAQLEAAVSRLLGAQARALVSRDAAIATDVDSPEDLDGLLAA